MPFVRLTQGARYQFENVLVLKGETIEVDNRTRNRLVKSGHFIDVAEERPAFQAMPEGDETFDAVGGQNLDDLDDPSLTGAKAEPEETGKRGGKGKGKVNQRGGSALANKRASTKKSAAALAGGDDGDGDGDGDDDDGGEGDGEGDDDNTPDAGAEAETENVAV